MYAEVAKLVAEDNVILAAVDCEQGSDTDFARSLPYNVTAYPTILYYQRGKLQFPYNHGHKKDRDSHRSQSSGPLASVNLWTSPWILDKDQFLSFLDNPTEKKEKTTWAEKATSKTHHLTTDNYDEFIKNHENVLIFFHALYAADLCAPMMDEWDLAAAELAEAEDETYFLAAVDQV